MNTLEFILRWGTLLAAFLTAVYMVRNWKKWYAPLILFDLTIMLHAAAMLLGQWPRH